MRSASSWGQGLGTWGLHHTYLRGYGTLLHCDLAVRVDESVLVWPATYGWSPICCTESRRSTSSECLHPLTASSMRLRLPCTRGDGVKIPRSSYEALPSATSLGWSWKSCVNVATRLFLALRLLLWWLLLAILHLLPTSSSLHGNGELSIWNRGQRCHRFLSSLSSLAQMPIILFKKILVVVYPLYGLLLGMLGAHLADAEACTLRLTLLVG